MKIPDIVLSYLAASNRFDAAAAADCFTLDAHVHDERRDHHGRDAIRGWIEEYTRKYRPNGEALTARSHGEGLLLTVRTSGAFPGSPIDLDYAIMLREGRISSLKVE